jgi:hypothetical protein
MSVVLRTPDMYGRGRPYLHENDARAGTARAPVPT